MGIYYVEITEKAEKDILKIEKSGDKATIKKLEKIIIELSNHPKIGVGSPEQLKHNLSGMWSRRLNKKDRLVYEIFEDPDNLVVVISALDHY
jgi:toxin YoeB